MPIYRKKVCRVCGRIYVRGYVRTAGVLGWCQSECYAKDLKRRREGIPQGQPPRPVDDGASREPRVLEALATVLREASPEQGTAAGDSEAEETEETGAMDIEVVADRALDRQTRLGTDGRGEDEWVGRCWAWLTEGDAPSLMDVGVRDGEIVKLLEPGQVRRVRAMERTIETAQGEVGGLEVWTDYRGFRAESEPDARVTARGLWEGGKVRLPSERPWADEEGRVGTLVRFSLASVEVDGRKLAIGPRDLEPVDSPEGSPTGPGGGGRQTEGQLNVSPSSRRCAGVMTSSTVHSSAVRYCSSFEDNSVRGTPSLSQTDLAMLIRVLPPVTIRCTPSAYSPLIWPRSCSNLAS